MALFLFLYILASHFYANTEESVSSHPDVVELSGELLLTKFRIGKSPICASETPCWIQESTGDPSWQKITIPSTNYDAVFNEKWGEDDAVYYRLKIKIPPKTMALGVIFRFMDSPPD